jgi:hypothetical protein
MELQADWTCGGRDKKNLADSVLTHEKDKPIGQVFDARFSWDELLDAAADVYLGVSTVLSTALNVSNQALVHLLDYSHCPRRRRLVFSTLAHGHLRL